MVTELSLQTASRIWCDPRTEHLTMNLELATVFAEKLDEYKDAIIWMSGSSDFAPEGQAGKHFREIRENLLS